MGPGWIVGRVVAPDAVPPVARERRQFGAQVLEVKTFEARVVTLAEDAEEVLERQRADRRELELEQRVLARICIDALDPIRAAQRVVEGIAAGTRDDQHDIVGTELQGLPVNRRIFPAGVVDEVARPDRIEQAAIETVAKAVPGSLRFDGRYRRSR